MKPAFTKRIAIATVILLLLITAALVALPYIFYPGVYKPIRTVFITNNTDRQVQVGYYQSWDNTWHTTVVSGSNLDAGQQASYHYKTDDRITVGRFLPKFQPDTDFNEYLKLKESTDSISLLDHTKLTIIIDPETGNPVIHEAPVDQ